MRAVVDTNVLLSALLWGGPPRALLEHARSGTITLITSPTLLAELARVMERPKFHKILQRTETSTTQALAELRFLAEVIDPPDLAHPICRDKDDDAVLALALAAQTDMVISGDDDLLALNPFESIPILSPAQALQFVAKQG